MIHAVTTLPRHSLRGSRFADESAAHQAVALTLPMLQNAVRQSEICGSGFLYIVVLDPGLSPAEASFDDALLLEHAIGDRQRWDADYAGFARAKARLSWESGQDTQRLQTLGAHRLRSGDSVLGGGVWLDGIVVAVSGAFPWYDEAFAFAIAANLRAIARQRRLSATTA
jgi:hypothetical protein